MDLIERRNVRNNVTNKHTSDGGFNFRSIDWLKELGMEMRVPVSKEEDVSRVEERC